MGIVSTSLLVVGGLFVGALLTSLVEPLLYRAGAQERGPTAAVQARLDVQLPQPDRWLYPAGPLIALLGVALAMVVLPFDAGLIGADLGIGVFYFIVVVDFVVLGIAVGGWGANTPNAVEACYRIVAQLVAYVVSLGLALMGLIMMARSLSTRTLWGHSLSCGSSFCNRSVSPLYMVTGLMQTYRPPFLEPFAKDIHHGIIEVYGGWKALTWRLALSGVLFVVAAMGAVLFLGGLAWSVGARTGMDAAQDFCLDGQHGVVRNAGASLEYGPDAGAVLENTHSGRARQRAHCWRDDPAQDWTCMILRSLAQGVAFAVFAFIAVAGALGMATTMSMFRSGIFLMASFIGVAGLFILRWHSARR